MLPSFVRSFVHISPRADDCHQRIFNIVINLAAINFRVFLCVQKWKIYSIKTTSFFPAKWSRRESENIETAHFDRRIRINTEKERRFFFSLSLLGSTFRAISNDKKIMRVFYIKQTLRTICVRTAVRVLVCVHINVLGVNTDWQQTVSVLTL